MYVLLYVCMYVLVYVCMYVCVMYSILAWAFFDEEISDLSPEEQKENNLIANLIEKKAGWTFPEGRCSTDIYMYSVLLYKMCRFCI